MYAIDKQKFGALIATLRKERGFTQRELAERLLISDKAVSKWETGASLPDVALLIPLSEQLGVSVTELLTGERATTDRPFPSQTVEDVVKAAICYAEESSERAYRQKSRSGAVVYALSLCLGGTGLLYNHITCQPHTATLTTLWALCAIFGAYFCFFVKTHLPTRYDEYPISTIDDGPFRMNMPGIRFTNANWPHIVCTARIWMCLSMALLPLLALALGAVGGVYWLHAGKYALLYIFLGVLFIPIYAVGRRKA